MSRMHLRMSSASSNRSQSCRICRIKGLPRHILRYASQNHSTSVERVSTANSRGSTSPLILALQDIPAQPLVSTADISSQPLGFNPDIYIAKLTALQTSVQLTSRSPGHCPLAAGRSRTDVSKPRAGRRPQRTGRAAAAGLPSRAATPSAWRSRPRRPGRRNPAGQLAISRMWWLWSRRRVLG